MAYTPKSKRLAKGDALKSSSLNNLSSNKKIDDILALSKGLNLSESDILKLQSDVVSINTSITSLQTSKQDLLVSGVNIKTVNTTSLLGSGNVSVEPVIASGTISQYWRGDKSWQTLPTAPAVTPAALTKTDDTNVTLTLGGSPSTALLQATSLTLGWTGTLADSRIASATTWNAKQATLVSGTNIKTINSTSLLGSGDIAISSGLTVGTTAITSGTVGRVLFEGTGNVLQESAGLSFATANNQLNIGTSTYLRGGTSYLDSFANGWGLYNCGLQSTFYGNNKDIWNVNTLSIGFASASARLDVKSAGALSTDLAFRVRNSADTKNIFKIQGDANAALGELTDTGTKTFSVNTYNNPRFVLGTGYSTDTGVISLTRRQGGVLTDNTLLLSQNAFADGNQVPYKHQYVNPSNYYGTNVPSYGYNAGFMYFKDSAVIANLQMKLSPDNALNIYSSAALPIETNFVDAFQLYSRDIIAGNAAPHFRTENGNIIKLYQQPTGGAASTFVTNTSGILNDTATFDGYTMGQVVKALRNLGLLT